jgi:hypothetical protein
MCHTKWTKDRTIFAEEAAQQVRQQLAFAADKAAAIQASPRLTALMDFRHAYIAHNLTLPEPDMKTERRPSPASAFGGSYPTRVIPSSSLLSLTLEKA